MSINWSQIKGRRMVIDDAGVKCPAAISYQHYVLGWQVWQPRRVPRGKLLLHTLIFHDLSKFEYMMIDEFFYLSVLLSCYALTFSLLLLNHPRWLHLWNSKWVKRRILSRTGYFLDIAVTSWIEIRKGYGMKGPRLLWTNRNWRVLAVILSC